MNNDIETRLSGTFTKENVEWLKKHAVTDKYGVIRCRESGRRILGRAVHRYRPQGAHGRPFVPEGDQSLTGHKQQEGKSFKILWCHTCGSDHIGPSHIAPDEFVFYPLG